MRQILLLNGPNLNLLGQRDQSVYGAKTLQDIEQEVIRFLKRYDLEVETFQSNHEGELVDALQKASKSSSGVIFNPAGYTHTSVAIRDAVDAIDIPVIEVHLSNIHNRESFRSNSYIAPVADGQITGLGSNGYLAAALAMVKILEKGES
ncbi:type II 3-dehydroquinate dehydratase [Aquisalibacillus elongatus]|uniref:3-dehydroquinate dehydratase n=1 Tax=Aquisalibacillus elongatus TaxID=485577 RepID=A0A3N5C828_9BACI|nr:type II 3-dehydroquinate dehydratase [Aquisalibacillus elongatus]RPF55652.1 3-dehydroquinate dehydratase [Aquisalibacillus elongatus]